MTDLDWGLLCRYAAGQCTPAERESFDKWLAAAPAHRRLFEWARTALVDADRTISPERKAEMLAALEDLAGVQDIAPQKRPARKPPARRRARKGTTSTPALSSPSSGITLPTGAPPWRPLAVAAAVMLAVGGSLAAGIFLQRSGANANGSRQAAVQVAAAPRGQRISLQLSDGTRVMLGPASRLHYPLAFPGQGPRQVMLEGEAFFEVVHDEQRPFVVRAGDLVATDLGTAFLVRAYLEDLSAHVVVREGKVAIRRAAGSDTSVGRVVTPGELGTLDRGVAVIQRADTAAHFAWTEGRLMFRRTPVREVLPELGRWYDVEFQVADPSLYAVQLSGTYYEQLTDETLKRLDISLGARHERQGRVITLYRADGTR